MNCSQAATICLWGIAGTYSQCLQPWFPKRCRPCTQHSRCHLFQTYSNLRDMQHMIPRWHQSILHCTCTCLHLSRLASCTHSHRSPSTRRGRSHSCRSPLHRPCTDRLPACIQHCTDMQTRCHCLLGTEKRSCTHCTGCDGQRLATHCTFQLCSWHTPHCHLCSYTCQPHIADSLLATSLSHVRIASKKNTSYCLYRRSGSFAKQSLRSNVHTTYCSDTSPSSVAQTAIHGDATRCSGVTVWWAC